jgi:hypothetical protein
MKRSVFERRFREIQMAQMQADSLDGEVFGDALMTGAAPGHP